jgi:hypothetical protein
MTSKAVFQFSSMEFSLLSGILMLERLERSERLVGHFD